MDPIKTEIVVVGAGPGGYAAAFYAADLGKKVILVERDKRLGGVCLNRGCIPSKALLYATHQIVNARESAHRGITFAAPTMDLAKLRAWKESILTKLGGGVAQLAKMRGVQVIQGRGYFEGSQTLRVETEQGQQFINYDQAIIAVGSKPAMPKAFDLGNPRVMTSTEALESRTFPKTCSSSAAVTSAWNWARSMPRSAARSPWSRRWTPFSRAPTPISRGPSWRTRRRRSRKSGSRPRSVKMATVGKQIKVEMEFDGKKEELYDRVLVSVGRVPNSADLGLENTKVTLDEKGFIKVNDASSRPTTRTFTPSATSRAAFCSRTRRTRKARIAVEVINGENSTFENVVIPAVVFTDPELAWCGLTEAEAKERKGIKYEVAKFPWAASGRALSFDRTDGVTKMIIDPETDRVLGVGIGGAGAGELIAEAVLAMEMGATAEDIALTVHPHPTLSETLMECAEAFYGHATHLGDLGLTLPRFFVIGD